QPRVLPERRKRLGCGPRRRSRSSADVEQTRRCEIWKSLTDPCERMSDGRVSGRHPHEQVGDVVSRCVEYGMRLPPAGGSIASADALRCASQLREGDCGGEVRDGRTQIPGELHVWQFTELKLSVMA